MFPRERACPVLEVKAKKQSAVRRPWTVAEMSAISKYFKHYIDMLKVPGKDDIETVMKTEKSLAGRTWRNIKDQVHNQIIKKKKC